VRLIAEELADRDRFAEGDLVVEEVLEEYRFIVDFKLLEELDVFVRDLDAELVLTLPGEEDRWLG
jgi:hypothetical protein